MQNNLLSFLPYNFARQILFHPVREPVGYSQRFQAVALFADISGFTRLSENLGKYGKPGTEELNRLLNLYFSAMLDLVEAYGGIVATFGGDALTVFFPCKSDKSNCRAVTRRALRCALRMQASVAAYSALPTLAGPFSLTTKIGLGLGPVFCTTVGNAAGQLEYVVAGQALEQCAGAEHLAGQGEIIIHNDLLPYAGNLEHADLNQDFSRVIYLAGAVRPAPLPALALPEPLPDKVRQLAEAYLHPSIAHRLEAGQSDLIAEHRKITILFARFADFDYDHDPAVGQKLQNYLSQVIEIIRRYDGYLHQVDMGDKGSKYIAFFGAPLAHENDETRALHCAWELSQLGHRLAIETQLGLNTGLVYLGLVGSTRRVEYAAIGDAVNLAARLMQAAYPGQILVSDFTRRFVKDRFKWEQLAPLSLKGKSAQVAVAALLGTQAEVAEAHGPTTSATDTALPIIGRESELKQVDNLLKLALSGQGQVIGITAEAGMGKSRLVREVGRMAGRRGMVGYSGECLSYATNTPYQVWHSILRGLFNLDTSQRPEAQVKQLENQLVTVDDQYGQRMPLLSVVLGLPIEDTDLTSSLSDPKLAKSLRESLIVDWLRARAKTQPILLVLEDIHWIDPLSHDLVEAIGRAIVDLPVLLVAAYRPPELERIKATRVMGLPYATEIRLKDFTSEEAERLIEIKLERLFGKRVEADPALTDRLLERAGGNPFYLDELINLIHDRGFDISQGQGLEGLEWPDNLQSLILSRLDQLDEGDKTTLKVASVVGQNFKADWLWAIYPRLGAQEQVQRQLTSLEQLNFTRLDKPAPELEYLFRHILTREVTYDSLAFTTRAELHGLVASFLEKRYAGQLDPYLDLLAYHYSHTRQLDKQREYYRRAGEAAQAAYANEAALEYYQRLLNLLQKPEEKLQMLLEIAIIERMTGAWESASKRLEQALSISHLLGNLPGMARSLRFLGLIQADRSDFDAALKSFRDSHILFRQLGHRQGIAEVLADLATVARNQGDYEASLNSSRESLALYRELDDKTGITMILNNMGLVADNLGDQAAARLYLEESLAVARESGNKIVLGDALNSLGVFTFYQGDYEADLRYVQESLALFQEVGYKHKMAISLSNLASPAFERGDFKTAQSYWRKGLALFRELGDKRQIARMLNNLAKAGERQGDYQEPQIFYRESLALRREVGDKEGIAQSVNNLGMLARLVGDYPTARRYLQEGLGLAREIGHKGQIILALHNLSYLALLEGRSGETESLITQSLAIALDMGSKSWLIDNLSLLVCDLSSRPARASLAAQLAGVIEELIILTGYQREPYMCRLYEDKLVELRTLLGSSLFEETVALGRATNLNEALQMVLPPVL